MLVSNIKFETSAEGTLVFLDGEDVTKLSVQSELENMHLKLQQYQSSDKHSLSAKERLHKLRISADGRDMATSIFPEANAKIYLTASAESRAERRVKQLQGMGLDAKINDILANIQARDKRDMERSSSSQASRRRLYY